MDKFGVGKGAPSNELVQRLKQGLNLLICWKIGSIENIPTIKSNLMNVTLPPIDAGQAGLEALDRDPLNLQNLRMYRYPVSVSVH